MQRPGLQKTRKLRPQQKLPKTLRKYVKQRLRDKLSVVYIILVLASCGFLVAWITITLTNFYALRAISSGDHSVVGNPTIDADFINRVLEHYHSPASGKGEALYDYGVKYNIDPAYALAFFMQESTFGTKGIATVTHSLGNIRATEGHPQYKGYRSYHSWEEGFEDWYRLIANLYVQRWGLSTVDQIIPVYAPASDNNDERIYIRTVKHAVDRWRTGTIVI